MHPYDREQQRRTREAIRAELGEKAFAAVWAVSRALPLEAVMTEAIGWSEEPAPPMPAASGSDRDTKTGLNAGDPFGLSPREREVLSLLAQRYTDSEIVQALFISPPYRSNARQERPRETRCHYTP